MRRRRGRSSRHLPPDRQVNRRFWICAHPRACRMDVMSDIAEARAIALVLRAAASPAHVGRDDSALAGPAQCGASQSGTGTRRRNRSGTRRNTRYDRGSLLSLCSSSLCLSSNADWIRLIKSRCGHDQAGKPRLLQSTWCARHSAPQVARDDTRGAGAAIGVSQQPVFSYEIGEPRMSVLVIAKLSKIFSTSVENIVGLSMPPTRAEGATISALCTTCGAVAGLVKDPTTICYQDHRRLHKDSPLLQAEVMIAAHRRPLRPLTEARRSIGDLVQLSMPRRVSEDRERP